MAVSSDTLFHFTNKESLKGILGTSGFWPSYSKENFNNIVLDSSPYVVSHIPIISFCDLRLTQLSNPNISIHTKDFGKFGLGLEKSWGIRKGISPVVYVQSKSRTSIIVNDLIKGFRSAKSFKSEKLKRSLSELVKFMKPYEGNYQKGNWKRKKRRYYDEREWRFVPPNEEYRVYTDQEFNAARKKKLNLMLRADPLKFKPDDIKFIVIERDDDKEDLARWINAMKIHKKDKIELITKIISFEEINNDY